LLDLTQGLSGGAEPGAFEQRSIALHPQIPKNAAQ